jgi:hypothetical protein
MTSCKQHEIELSALLDGESDPATAVVLMDHISHCRACRDFYRELRSFQSLVDGMVPAAEAVTLSEPDHRRRSWAFPVPRWIWGAAAAVLIAIGSYAAGSLQLIGGGNGDMFTIERTDGQSSGDEERFVELATEVLRSDRQYQQQLYRVLGEIETNEGSGEAPANDEFDDEDRSENYNELFAVIGGRRVVN